MTIGRKTILVLEDEPLIAIAIEDLIRDLGFSPFVCGTIEKALQIVERREIALAVLDYKIRDEDSGLVALALRHRSVPFLVCSGTVLDGLPEAFSDAPFLSKPYTDEQFRSAVLAALNGRA